MSHFKDLTPYAYSMGEKSNLPVLNVGWLSRDELFTTGEVLQLFKDNLFRFCQDENAVLVRRGFHNCEFCPLSWDEWAQKHPSYGAHSGLMSIGNGEIRIIGYSAVYAAPTLIYHYVIEHDYRPPQEFIDAVLRGPAPNSIEYKYFLNKYR